MMIAAFVAVMPGISGAGLAQEATTENLPVAPDSKDVLPTAPAPVGPTPDEPVSYDPELARLATILGSLHYLRNLCGEAGNQWREEMETIILTDKMEGLRKKKAIAAFNDGYQAFSNSYTLCNLRAVEAIQKFQSEGAVLTAAILTRYKS